MFGKRAVSNLRNEYDELRETASIQQQLFATQKGLHEELERVYGEFLLRTALENFWMEGNVLALSKKLSLILKENEQLENSLRRNLGKVGVDFDVFMQKLDQDNKPII